MAIFNEAVFENSIIELLEKLGYKHILNEGRAS